MTVLRAVFACVEITLLAAFPVVAQDTDIGSRPSIVVTTAMLGAIVSDLAGDDADVTVLMPRGVDPHEWQPSARDIEAIHAADLVVVNGLGLEAGLLDVLEQAEAGGVVIFVATDHITVRQTQAGSVAHELGTGDPHFWLDPLAMRDVVAALVPALGDVGIEVDDRAQDLMTRLEELDAEARAILDVVPPERRKLVTGHDSMGYFADRYGFTLVGAVIPGLSTQGEVSARQLAALVEVIRSEDVPAIFTEVGTPLAVAEAVAGESGAGVIELPVEQLPDDGSYATFIRGIATTVAETLGG